MHWRREGASGITLLELVIVVAVLAAIAVIALPRLVGSRLEANEAAALQTLRGWPTAQEQFHRKEGHYANSLEQLVEAGLVSRGEEHDGYRFTIRGPRRSRSDWYGYAEPLARGESGERSFFISHEMTIHWTTEGRASPKSPALR